MDAGNQGTSADITADVMASQSAHEAATAALRPDVTDMGAGDQSACADITADVMASQSTHEAATAALRPDETDTDAGDQSACADIVADVIALQKAYEAAIAARRPDDTDMDCRFLYIATTYAVGTKWCADATDVVRRLTGQVPLETIRMTLLHMQQANLQITGHGRPHPPSGVLTVVLGQSDSQARP